MAQNDSLTSSTTSLVEGAEVEESKILDSRNQVVQAISHSETIRHDDLSLKNADFANTNQNFDSFTILEGLSIQNLINILNDAMNKNNFEELNQVVDNIENYFVTGLDVERFKNFCIDHLGLKLKDQMVGRFEERQSRGDHSHIFSKILSRRCDIEKNNCNYSAKELLLLAIAASDKLTERYQDLLFDKKDLSLLPLLVGGEKYISAFIERFPNLYIKLKDQVVQLNELNKIGFFSIIALRKEQNLWNSVLVEQRVLGDLKEVLQKGSSDPLYCVLETASLVQNEEFIKKVLDVLEKDATQNPNDSATKALLNRSFVTLLKTAISQEHDSIVEYLCKKCIESKGTIIQEIYKEAFKKVRGWIRESTDNADREDEGKQKICDLVLQTALRLFSVAGFNKQEVLELCNLCGITYGDNDENLSQDGYKTKAELINEGYKIIPFYYSEKNKRCAGFVFAKDREITIAYRGTQDFDDCITDINTVLTSGNLYKDGKCHRGFHNAFEDSLPSLNKILEDHANSQKTKIEDFRITCTGHSMGGALATIAALHLKEEKSVEYVRAATFGSPRVFDLRGAKIYNKLLGENTIRVTNFSDPVPIFPTGFMGFKHVGESLKIKIGNLVENCSKMDLSIQTPYYHKTKIYYKCIQDIEPEDFQPDNNVSRYYYPSYLVALPYYLITTSVTTPYYLAQSIISNKEQQCFEKTISLSAGQKFISNDTGFSVEFTAGNISEIAQRFLNAGISQVVVPTPISSSIFLDFNEISKASQEELQKMAKALKDLFTRDEFNSRIVNGITNFHIVKTPGLGQGNNTHGNSQQPSDQVSNIRSDDVEVISTTTNVNNTNRSSEYSTDPGQSASSVNQASTSSNQITLQQESVVSMPNARMLSVDNDTCRDLCVVTLDTQQVVLHSKCATALSVNFTVSDINKALQNLSNNGTLNIEILFSNGRSFAQIFKKSDQEIELSFSSGNTYGLDLHLVNKESLEMLLNKENLALANAINNFSTVKTPILEQKSGKNEQAPTQLARHVIQTDQPIREDNSIGLMGNSEEDVGEAQVNNTQGSSKYSSGPEQTLEILNEHHSNITTNTHVDTALHLAAVNGHLDTVKYLVDEKHVDVNQVDNHGLTALHFAAVNGYLDIVKYLIDEKHVDVNQANNYGSTALHKAAFGGILDIVKYLIDEKHVDANQVNNHGDTALHLAVERNDNVTKFLIQKTLIQDFSAQKPDYLIGGFSIYWDECKNEIEGKKIGSSDILYLDLLKADTNEMASYVINGETENGLSNLDYEREFPIFGSQIKNKFCEGMKRRELIDDGTRVIQYFYRCNNKDLSKEIGEKIASYLSNADLENLRKAELVSPKKDSFNKKGMEYKNDFSEQEDYGIGDVESVSTATSNPDKNNAASQNTKRSKLPFIAVSLAITGVATGIAIAVYLEMLAVGIAVGACCLVAAAIIYCCRPKSLIENDKVEESFGVEKKEGNVGITQVTS